MKFFYFLIGIMLLNCAVFAQSDSVIVFDSKTEMLNIGKEVYFLEDKEGKLNIEDILKPDQQKQFVLNDKDVFVRPASKNVVWFKIVFQNQSQADIWLEMSYSLCWYIDFFRPIV